MTLSARQAPSAGRVMVLLSIGRHPHTGRPRGADLDARALELALCAPGAEILAVHAGIVDELALRAYLGMGLRALTVLESAAGENPYPLLLQHIQAMRPDMVLCGVHAGTGEASGYLPYSLAHALGLPLAASISSFDLAADGVRLWCALGRGRRRELKGRPPLFATVGDAAPRARQSAFARARRGRIEVLCYPQTSVCAAPIQWHERPARPRPKRSGSMPANLSGEELLKAMTEKPSRGGRVLKDLSAHAAADCILEYLAAQKVL